MKQEKSLRNKRWRRLNKLAEEQALHGGITVVNPDIDVSMTSQQQLDILLQNRQDIQISQKPIEEQDIAEVPIKKRKQALSLIFYTVEWMKKIAEYTKEVNSKEIQLTEALKSIMENDEQIKWVGSEAVDVLFNETKKIFNQNADLVERISEIEQEKYKLQEEMKECYQK